MDIKWKNKKKTISFLILFLGISLSLGNLVGILREKPSNARFWQLDRLLEDDYQESGRFREYVENRLWKCLVMATGGEGLWDTWGYEDGAYYDGSYEEFYFPLEAVEGIAPDELTEYLDSFASMQENYLDLLEIMEELDEDQWTGFQSELEIYQEEMESSIEFLRDYVPRLDREQAGGLTDEQKQKIVQKYHENMKGDKNLLYTIYYDGKELYNNWDTAMAEGKTMPSLPAGYNFLLYFDGEKANIYKDGKEIDVYGDGYYRDGSDWHLPGYINFQADDSTKKAVVYIAVAKEPVLYTQGDYGSGGARQYDNALYWMNKNLQDRRERILRGFYGLFAGLPLLLIAFFWKKSCKEAIEGIAGFQAKIWAEWKVLLFFLLFYALYMQYRVFMTVSYGYDIWEDWYQVCVYDQSLDTVLWFFRKLAGGIHPVSWVAMFWGIWLFWNDLRHNKAIWRHSFGAKIYRAFTAKSLSLSMTKKMCRRNLAVFLTALVYGLVMLAEVTVSTVWDSWGILTAMRILFVFETVLFLGLQYMAGVKNMKAARDVEILADRIAQIRNGDYREACDREEEEKPVESELKTVMAQLEDIHHGMAVAVEEQTKSERMKVELIANVSHDIKTPLTSIISYVEILKQEEELPDHVKDYIKILDEKSQRLHHMVQDVFAVSKAASGELPMQMEELDFGKLLQQTLADMEEQIRDCDVTFRTELPDAPVMIMADGQRMYRVFQNLFQNAIKYSLQGSRVYVALRVEGHLALASVKNTSRQELDKDRDFSERFARGDQSRTDGGSGLGLSIAQSFTEACGGEFFWETDADLFVVKVTFKVI